MITLKSIHCSLSRVQADSDFVESRQMDKIGDTLGSREWCLSGFVRNELNLKGVLGSPSKVRSSF